MWKNLLISLLTASALWAQEANFGFTSPVTVSFFTSQTSRSGAGAVNPAFRANFYPTVKLGEHWFAYAAVQVHSNGYFYEQLASPGHRVRAHIVQAYAGYSRLRAGRSLTVKAGYLASAFGAFPLRYDDQRNWLIDLPQAYGYYYTPVTVLGTPGVEIDAAWGKTDWRLQLTNSSPSNPRGWRASDQYLNWTAGAGVTLRPGFRLGASFTHGPYLHRGHPFFLSTEARPVTLPATGYGVDARWGRGRWSVNGELMRFQYAYRAVPYFFNSVAYGEAKLTLTPRAYIAGRVGSRWRSGGLGSDRTYEFAFAFRPGDRQLVKIGYLALDGPFSPGTRDNVLGVQYSLSLTPPAWVWDK